MPGGGWFGGGGGSGGGGWADPSTVLGPETATDNALARYDSTTGKLLQDGVVTEDDPGALSGITQLNVDNLRLDGNTLSATNANGDVVLARNGSGTVEITGEAVRLGSAGAPVLARASATVRVGTNGGVLVGGDGGGNPTGIYFNDSARILFANGGADYNAGDVGERRAAAGVIRDIDGPGDGMGKRLTGRLVEASTAGSGAPNVIAATESRTLFTNDGATAENYHTLPSAAPGQEFLFNATDSDGIRVTAAAGDEIEVGGSVSAVAGFIRLAANAKAWLIALNATRWSAQVVEGVVTVDV